MLRVLTYHRIARPEDTPSLDPALVSAPPDAFRKQMMHLKKRYRPVDMSHVQAAFVEGHRLPPRAVLVTVDDAYRDFAEYTWPILSELGIPVTVFVPTAYPDQPRMLWWDTLHRATGQRCDEHLWRQAVQVGSEATDGAIPADLENRGELRALLRTLPHDVTERFVATASEVAGAVRCDAASSPSAILSWDELRDLARDGVTFGVHTRNHAALASLDEDVIRSEIRGSIDDLARELGPGPYPIAYPYGSYDGRVARIAREEGCTLGFTCDDGLSEPGTTDPFRLSRTNITVRTSPALFRLRMLPWFAEVDRWRHRHNRARVPA